ncbi:hypothetical protein SNE40_003525 [Patella caerulea]|uniref:JmjC domain-containing protein n=1 Tax=Patella caerulea TaxID=87958 RepID=A0AAN8Q0X7_PATCE
MITVQHLVQIIILVVVRICNSKSAAVFSPADILMIAKDNCAVVTTGEINEVIRHVSSIFNTEDNVVFGRINVDGFLWPDKTEPKFNNKFRNKHDRIIIFQKVVKDRSCLHKIPELKPNIIEFEATVTIENLVNFINEHCFTYKSTDGSLSFEGLHRLEILRTLHHVENISNLNMGKMYEDSQTLTCAGSHDNNSCHSSNEHNLFRLSKIPECERIKMEDPMNFFHEYLKISKPVIIEGAMEKWKSYKWTEKFFRKHYGKKEVHIKLTSGGDYEGVESVSLWENYTAFSDNIPLEVKLQLKFPDLVVVRPATLNMNFSQFLDLINLISNQTVNNLSAYLEYSSIREYFPELENDIEEMSFIQGLLNLNHLNIWLSDGNTLGKTHFDPYDNFLCQISGKKEVILFDPHDNSRLYEAHIPEAILSYNKEEKIFKRKELAESTSLVMSPVDILKPDFKRFPKFADAYPLNCTIDAGDVLFIPAFWWHEVQSYPSKSEHRNLAVNFWYEPFLTKEFPCQDCPLDINPNYRHLL